MSSKDNQPANRPSGPSGDSGSDGPQGHYTGGEKSICFFCGGIHVQDPSKGNYDVDSLFEQARQMGAVEEPLEYPFSSSRSFTGTGRQLSGETVPQLATVIHNIYFWSDGFTVNDGPLRSFDDPENTSFLESLGKCECPKELETAGSSYMVQTNLMSMEERCPEPVKRRTPFQGVGRSVGGGSSSDTPISELTPAAAAASSTAVSTSIQLTLADGTWMVARFNTHHTVGDIRAFIDGQRPRFARTYQLQTLGFPPTQLTDPTRTIQQAALANSALIQMPYGRSRVG